MMVMNGLVALAGSILSLFMDSGIMVPNRLANNTMANMLMDAIAYDYVFGGKSNCI